MAVAVRTSRSPANLRPRRHARCSLLAAALLLCANAPGPAAQEPERILDFRVDGEDLVFRVTTHGCTHKDDFVVQVAPFAEGASQVMVTLLRVRRDECKGFVLHGEEITFTREELGVPSGAQVLTMNAPRSLPTR